MGPIGRFTAPPLAEVLGRLLDALLPPRCALCGGRASGRSTCAACLDDLPWLDRACRRCGLPLPPGASGECPERCALTAGAPLERVFAPLEYAYPVERLVARAKFGRSLAAGRVLGELLLAGLARLPPVPLGPDVVVPIPLHWRRLAARGFNQATEIARVVARARGWPLRPDLLARVTHAPAQSGLPARARRRNVARAFRARPLAGLRVVLVDDVATTVATGLAAAAALRAAGASRVELWAVARALPPAQPAGTRKV